MWEYIVKTAKLITKIARSTTKCEKQQTRRTPVYKYSKMLGCEFPKGIASIEPKLRDGQSVIS